jgi:hypothetical protein
MTPLRWRWLAVLLLAVIDGPAAVAATPDKTAAPPATKDEPFRPEVGKFPPLDKAYAYRGELVFVDRANRRGSLRVQTEGYFFRNSPHPFALLPYGIVRHLAAPADLRDIPLGTMLHVRGFLPPDPRISVVPVLPVNNKDIKAFFLNTAVAPAENHLLLLEDEPSHCRREGKIWKLAEVDVKDNAGTIVASREPKAGGDAAAEKAGNTEREKLTFDAATRIHRGRESLTIEEWIAEGGWPAEGKKDLGGQAVYLGITWKPTTAGVGVREEAFTSFHASDIWLDEAALDRAAGHQTRKHKDFIRSRWMPAWVDAVEYGKLGQATVTATLFGGMDPSLYADFKKGITALMNGAEDTLKHADSSYGPAHMAAHGRILDVTQPSGDVPLGSSGIQIRFETKAITEGLRPGRVVRVRPHDWPQVQVPREEFVGGFGIKNHEERFPPPTIFPTYVP